MSSVQSYRFSYALKIISQCMICFSLLTLQVQAAGPMLPKTYREQTDINNWLMSEKLDGIRAYWNGKQLLSKNAHPLSPSKEFIAMLPPFALEGELWGGRGTFEQTASIVKQQLPHSGWRKLQFAIFDVPESPGAFTTRIAKASAWFDEHPSTYAFVIQQVIVQNPAALEQELRRIEKLGGEGLIVRNPTASYRAGRSSEILKVKSFQDAEAKVIAHLPGKGRNSERLGALQVQLEDGMEFKIGSGFSDTDRESPPPVGTLITFKYYGRYQSGIPKFPSYLRIRKDNNL